MRKLFFLIVVRDKRNSRFLLENVDFFFVLMHI